MNRIALRAHDGRTLAGYRFDPPATSTGSVVIAGAMATPQSFYAPFATYLAAAGYSVWIFDYRDTGESLQGGMRGAKSDITDWVARDYDAVVTMAAEAQPGVPLFVVGTVSADRPRRCWCRVTVLPG